MSVIKKEKIKVRAPFYNHNKKFANSLISIWTWPFNMSTPHVSHTELGFLIGGKWRYFSSTNRDGGSGTRWISEKELFKHPERWIVLEFEVDTIQDKIDRAEGIEGLPYDFLAILGFFTPFGVPNFKGKWCCSEAAYYVLTGEWKKRISPRRFWTYIKKTYTARRVRI